MPQEQKQAMPDLSDTAWVFPGVGAARLYHSDAQSKLHREALVVANDPVIARIDKLVASAQEGGLCQIPAKLTHTVKLLMDCFR